jgi:hypothetical protein
MTDFNLNDNDFILSPKSENTYHYNLLLNLDNEFTVTNTIHQSDYNIYKKYDIYDENDNDENEIDDIDFNLLLQITINHDKYHDINIYWYDKSISKEIHYTFSFHFIESIYYEVNHNIGESKLVLSFDTKTINIDNCPIEINIWFQNTFFNLFHTQSKI